MNKLKSWKKHAIWLTIYVLISTPLTAELYMLSPTARAYVEALTNASNLIALFYAVYIYRLYDEAEL